jgi:hypothetical protein
MGAEGAQPDADKPHQCGHEHEGATHSRIIPWRRRGEAAAGVD